jgi:hypothetical protein
MRDWPQRNPHVHYWTRGRRKHKGDPGNYYEFHCPWCLSKLVKGTNRDNYPTQGDLELNNIKRDCQEQLVSQVMDN